MGSLTGASRAGGRLGRYAEVRFKGGENERKRERGLPIMYRVRLIGTVTGGNGYVICHVRYDISIDKQAHAHRHAYGSR